jgi:[ribosomal protein S5]-alanine N-acetyltransferase
LASPPAPASFPDSLRGASVLLRPLRVGDVNDEYIGWLNDPVLMRYSNQRFVHHDRASCVRYLRSFEGSDNLLLSVRWPGDDRAVGTMTAYRSRHHGTADLGILIGAASARGQGIGHDAWNTLAQWLLHGGGTRKLTCGTLACNAAMLRIAVRAGMVREAVRSRQEVVDGQAVDVVYFARFGND